MQFGNALEFRQQFFFQNQFNLCMFSIVMQCHSSSIIYIDVLKALNHQLDALWREFGTFLYVDRAVMEGIKKDTSNVSACMLHLVEKWLYHEDGTGNRPRTWDTVVQAVKDTGNGLLAEQLAQEYAVQLQLSNVPK